MGNREASGAGDPAGRRPILAAVFAIGVSSITVQLALMREMLGAFAGNELFMGVVLGNWLLLMGLGTWLARWVEPRASSPCPVTMSWRGANRHATASWSAAGLCRFATERARPKAAEACRTPKPRGPRNGPWEGTLPPRRASPLRVHGHTAVHGAPHRRMGTGE